MDIFCKWTAKGVILHYGEELDRCKIHRIDENCLEFSTLEEFEAALLQSVAQGAEESYLTVFPVNSPYNL